jgi:uncharacterized protein YndB with AHSA1/START domain
MKEFHGRATAHVPAPAREVFELITDVDRLPEWNAAIESVIDRPAALSDGVHWTVQMHPPRSPRWGSVSRVERFDRQGLRFAYQTRNTDGNHSFVKWTWDVVAGGDGCDVSVAWDCYLKTLDRRLLGGPIRKRQLAREVRTSLESLAAVAGATADGSAAGVAQPG